MSDNIAVKFPAGKKRDEVEESKFADCFVGLWIRFVNYSQAVLSDVGGHGLLGLPRAEHAARANGCAGKRRKDGNRIGWCLRGKARGQARYARPDLMMLTRSGRVQAGIAGHCGSGRGSRPGVRVRPGFRSNGRQIGALKNRWYPDRRILKDKYLRRAGLAGLHQQALRKHTRHHPKLGAGGVRAVAEAARRHHQQVRFKN